MSRSPGRRVVLVGASNLAQGLDLALAETLRRVGPDTRVLAACGRGRSYGLRSSFLARGLPAVLDSGLWRALDAPPHAALLVDIGNDLAYGVEPERVLGWVRETARRLATDRLVIAGLPCAPLERRSPRTLALWARVIFPTRSPDVVRLVAAVRELDRGLADLARELGASRVELDPRWYGADPIHFARSERRAAWSALLASFGEPTHPAGTVPSSVRRSRAEERTLFGIPFGCAQPCWRANGGAELSLY
ncbi:MAG: hypothetical protein IT453_13830 [Planctomycetes bacterium]|nr:hypothetical protein [Planctomycetota bacterium]